MQSQQSLPTAPLEDRQLIQITIDNETNGKEFQFSDEILAKEIILKGYTYYYDSLQVGEYKAMRGTVDVEIDWLKVTGVQLTRGFSPDPKFEIRLPYEFRLALPAQTSMRRRFKATAKWYDGVTYGVLPYHTENFRLVLYLEVVHDHVFR